jgi:hypothetical protein
MRCFETDGNQFHCLREALPMKRFLARVPHPLPTIAFVLTLGGYAMTHALPAHAGAGLPDATARADIVACLTPLH